MTAHVLPCSSFQQVLDRAIGLAHCTDIGYAVVAVRPNSVILSRKGITYEYAAGATFRNHEWRV